LEDGEEVRIVSTRLTRTRMAMGCFDGLEVVKGLNATNPDTDRDGLSDFDRSPSSQVA